MEGDRVTTGENCIPGRGTDGTKRAEQEDSSVPCHMRQHRRGRERAGCYSHKAWGKPRERPRKARCYSHIQGQDPELENV